MSAGVVTWVHGQTRTLNLAFMLRGTRLFRESTPPFLFRTRYCVCTSKYISVTNQIFAQIHHAHVKY